METCTDEVVVGPGHSIALSGWIGAGAAGLHSVPGFHSVAGFFESSATEPAFLDLSQQQIMQQCRLKSFRSVGGGWIGGVGGGWIGGVVVSPIGGTGVHGVPGVHSIGCWKVAILEVDEIMGLDEKDVGTPARTGRPTG